MQTKYLLNAFDTLAGSSFGGYNSENFVDEMIGVCIKLQIITIDEVYDYFKMMIDPDPDVLADCIDELIEKINEHPELMPPCCCAIMDDNEVRIIPYLDDDVPGLADYPKSKHDDHDVIFIVNDHGNVTCQEWTGAEYVTVWEMV